MPTPQITPPFQQGLHSSKAMLLRSASQKMLGASFWKTPVNRAYPAPAFMLHIHHVYSVPLAAPLPVPLVVMLLVAPPPKVSLILGPPLGAMDSLGVPATDAVAVECPSCPASASSATKLGCLRSCLATEFEQESCFVLAN